MGRRLVPEGDNMESLKELSLVLEVAEKNSLPRSRKHGCRNLSRAAFEAYESLFGTGWTYEQWLADNG